MSLEVSPETVRGGDNINVTCTVLGDPEEDVNFAWVYPGQVNTAGKTAASKIKQEARRWSSQPGGASEEDQSVEPRV